MVLTLTKHVVMINYQWVIIISLSIIFKNCIESRIFPDIWKKFNIVLVHKKGDEQIIHNYRPISLLPVLGKIFQRIFFNLIFEFLNKNNLLCEKQSVFRHSYWCSCQLLFSINDIFKSFDYNLKHRHFLSLWKGIAWGPCIQTWMHWYSRYNS